MSDGNDPKTLLLRETGIAHLQDGRVAVNVGPIVAALNFLTEGRGEDRGVDEAGEPLPDLLSLAFDVVRSIIVGGRHADYFRQVKRDFDAQAADGGQASLALAKQASAVRRNEPEVQLEWVANDIQARLQSLQEAAAQLVQELSALQGDAPALPAPRRRAKKTAKAKATARPKVAKSRASAPKPKKKKKTRRA